MSFNIAISGLKATGEQLNSISNNIANVSTTGFKASRTEFSSVYNGMQAGGVEVASITQNFDLNGGLYSTGRALDLGLTGTGFFSTVDSKGQNVYTRSGAFTLDKDNMIVNAQGNKLQGFGTDSNGNILKNVGDLSISEAQLAAKATSNVEFAANFDSRATEITAAFDPDDATTFTSSYTTETYDSLGNAHTTTQYFVKTGDNSWQVHVTVNGENVKQAEADASTAAGILATEATAAHAAAVAAAEEAAGTPGEGAANDLVIQALATMEAAKAVAKAAAKEAAVAEVNFNTDGSLNTETSTVPFTIKTFPLGAEPMEVEIDLTGSTQYAADFGVSKNNPDGYISGELTGIRIEEDGLIYAQYSNGQNQLQGQVIIADFPNPNGMVLGSGTSWTQSFASGHPIIGTAGSGVFGSMHSGTLEGSNVDLTTELVDLMTAQRNYQANTKTISTADQMTQILFNAV